MSNALVDALNSSLAHLSTHDDYAGFASDLFDMLTRSISTSSPCPFFPIFDRDKLSRRMGALPLFEESEGWEGGVHGTIKQDSVTSYYTPYTYSAKERDLETGYSFFGARYYDPNVSVWLSVDPLSDKYPSMCVFMNCSGSSVKYIDPDGRLIWDSVKREPVIMSYDVDGNVTYKLASWGEVS